MAIIADPEREKNLFDYILGDVYKGMSIATDRYYYLWDLNCKHELKIALKDSASEDAWTKWVEFPGLLWKINRNKFGFVNSAVITAAIDVHRSVLPNEIIIESDYKTYEENYEAASIVGKIIEEKGFKPLYYYSGNKSIHIHVFFDWSCLSQLDPMIQDQLRLMFRESKLRFKKKFIQWLRTKMITCWDTNVRKFDTDLIRATHLIRCELSKNKLGFKTFLGYTYRDMSFIPYVCNERNRIYPKLGEIKLSSPLKIHELMDEFITDMEAERRKDKEFKRSHTLGDYGVNNAAEILRTCVKAILSEEFKNAGDGFKRGMFILLNELKLVLGDSEAAIVINDWNARMGFPIQDKEIEYRLKMKNYSLSCKYIHEFLKEVGIDISKKCRGKY